MRILVAITLVVCSVALSGCSRWCSCPAKPPPLAPEQYGHGNYSDSYRSRPQGHSYKGGNSDYSYDQLPPSNSYGQRARPSDP
jgi:hypothetical protein